MSRNHVNSHASIIMLKVGRTFDSSKFTSKLAKPCNHGVVLHALPLLASQPPPVCEARVVCAITADASRRALTSTSHRRAGGAKGDGIGAAAEDCGYGGVW